MKESHSEGVANHTGPESCAGSRKASGEALTGVRAGRVSSREIPKLQGADVLTIRKAISHGPKSRVPDEPGAVGDLLHVRKHSVRNSGDPMVAWR